MMLGLKRDIVRLADHNSEWAALAGKACGDIKQAAKDLVEDIQHVGSTAVPDLPAKPILDLAASVMNSNAVPEIIQRLSAIGYIYRGDGGDEGGHLFIFESSPDVRTVHLHVVSHNGTQWKNYIRFRNLLCQQHNIRCRYAELKRMLEKRYSSDRKSYTDAKHDFIQEVLRTGHPPSGRDF